MNGYPKRIVNSVIKKCDDMSVKKKEIHIDKHICNLYLFVCICRYITLSNMKNFMVTS